MVNMANIICKTAGVAGMSAVVYDAIAHGQHHSAVASEELSSDVFEKAVAAELTNSNASHVTGAMQKKITDLRMNNPVVPLVGKIKGYTSGILSSLADNIIPITCSAVALAAKGKLQKAGAWGLGIFALYKVAKEGFGLGKKTPIDE